MVPEPNENTTREGLAKGARFLCDLYVSTIQALVDVAGLDRAIELMTPYYRFHLDAVAQGLKTDTLWQGFMATMLKSDDLYSMALLQGRFFIGIGVIFDNHQFFEHGYTMDVRYCPFANLSEDICLFHEHLDDHVMQIVNRNYQVFYTKMRIRGDPFCQVIIKKKGYTIRGEVTKKPVEVPIPQWSDEEKEYWQSAGFSQLWIYATNALVDFAGKEKAAEILRPYMKALGILIANDLSKELRIKDRDALAIASIIDRCNQATNQKGSYTYRTPERADKEITECIFSNASQDICADALEARSNGICEAINPLYEFHSTKRMCKGDKVCHWVIKKR